MTQLELISEVLDPALGQAVGPVGLQPGLFQASTGRRGASPMEGVVRDAEVGGQILDRLAGQHPCAGPLAELARGKNGMSTS
jgi:hypothetical protein